MKGHRFAAGFLASVLMVVLCMVLVGCSGLTGSAPEAASDISTQTDSQEPPEVAGVTVAEQDNVQTFDLADGEPVATLKIASGSENKEAARAIKHAVGATGVAVEMHYMGSLDIMAVLEAGGEDYDAVWPASSMWISMGDTQRITRNVQSTSTTPVVFGIAKSKAIELGWADESGTTTSPTTAEILEAVQEGRLTFAMTSATQSNSGASAYLAFLTALSEADGPLTSEDLADGNLTGRVAALLDGVDRSSGSSDWLKEMVVADPDQHQAMVNYESLVSQANRELEEAGDEPMLVIYPADGIAVSDSPLAFVDRGQSEEVESAFKSFQEALAEPEAALEMERVGRRTGLGGKVVHADDAEVEQAFSSEWGIIEDASALKSIPLPAGDVISQALTLYQTGLKKASYTVWAVDYSGSMLGAGKQGVVDGLTQALDPARAAESMIQPTEDDVNVLIPFAGQPDEALVATGSDTAALLRYARDREAIGGTDMYAALIRALDFARRAKTEGGYTVAIALMSDGVSETYTRDAFISAYAEAAVDVPIFPIMFGDADPTQLDELSSLSNGRTFDGRSGDLASVFRQVKGYN